jgi:signal transduction histidine kinase
VKISRDFDEQALYHGSDWTDGLSVVDWTLLLQSLSIFSVTPGPILSLIRFLLLLAVISFSGTSTAFGQPAKVVLETGTRSVDLGGRVQVLLDSKAELGFEQMIREKFSPLQGNLNLGYWGGVAWLRFDVERAPGASAYWWLEIRPAALDEVTLYWQDGDGHWHLSEQGDTRPWAGRDLQYRHSAFVLSLPEGEMQTFYLRVATTSAFSVAPRLVLPEAFLDMSVRDSLVLGGFFLCTLIIVLMNLLQAILLRQHLYTVYALYVLVIGAFLLLAEGVLHVLLGSAQSLRVESWISILHAGILLMLGLLFCTVVDLDRLMPRLAVVYRRLLWMLAGLGCLAVPLGFDGWLKPWLWWFVLLQIVGQLILAAWFALKGHRQSRFYVLAFGALLGGSGYTLLSLLGIVETRVWSNMLTIGGSLVHMALMQLTVNDHVYEAKRSLDRAREDALEASCRASAGLEEAVARRTAELDQARQQLERALEDERAIKLDQQRFLRMVAHEFRTPLAIIASAADVIELGRLDNAALHASNLARLRQAVRRLAELLDNALAQDRLDSAAWRINTEWIPVCDLLNDAREFGEMLTAGGRVFEVRSGDERLQGDRELLRVLLHNLVDNAVKHTAEAGRITIEAHALSDGGVRLSVTDDGVGVGEDELPKLFGKYYRGVGTSQPGLGLGLYLVDNIATLHGGSVCVQSAPGNGCRFEVRLPSIDPAR